MVTVVEFTTSKVKLNWAHIIKKILCIWTVSVRLPNFAIDSKYREGGYLLDIIGSTKPNLLDLINWSG